MSLERFTQRARNLILNISPAQKIKVKELLVVIDKSEGMGRMLLQAFPKLRVKKETLVNINDLVKEAFYQSIKFEHSYVGTEHIFLAMLKLTGSPDFENAKAELVKSNLFSNVVKHVDKGKKTPLINAFGENLNYKLFREAERPILFRDEYNSLVSVLLQKENSNPLLVGDKGVGKRTLINLLAKNINSLEVPSQLAGYQIIEFDILAFMANVFNKGNMDFSLGALVEELRSIGRVILSIKNLQNIFFSSSAGLAVPMFYSMFRSSLEGVGIKIIATVDLAMYDRIIADNDHVFDRFTVVEVGEPKEDQTLKILQLSAGYLGQFHNLEIPEEVVLYVYKRAKSELKGLKFPQKGIFLLDQSCSRVILRKSAVPESYKSLIDTTFMLAQNMDRVLDKGNYDEAMKIRQRIKNVETRLTEKEKKIMVRPKVSMVQADIDNTLRDIGFDKKEVLITQNISSLGAISSKMKKRIIAQDEAVDAVAKSLIRAKLGLRSRNRPMGNFLFLGPTGVGKTELAKVLAEVVFGEGSLIRLDMSDFAEKHNVARLVGAPPGYVGYNEGGELTQKIDANPHSVVLFDEIEKAHPDVLNILLQITEEGELSDAKGNTFDFSRAIIILTSNIGTDIIHNPEIGFAESTPSDDTVTNRLKANLKKILKPELINRFDEIVVFKGLKQKDQLRVLDLLIKEVVEKLKEQKITLKVAKSAKTYLLKQGYSAEYGARALRRTLERELLDKIAEKLMKNNDRPLVISIAAGKLGIDISVTAAKKGVK